MNSYGRRAQRHWARMDPQRYAAIADPQTFFQELGERVEQEIQALADRLAGPDLPGESYLEKTGRLNMARLSAEDEVLRELVLIADPDEEDLPATDLISDVMSAIEQANREDDDPAA